MIFKKSYLSAKSIKCFIKVKHPSSLPDIGGTSLMWSSYAPPLLTRLVRTAPKIIFVYNDFYLVYWAYKPQVVTKYI